MVATCAKALINAAVMIQVAIGHLEAAEIQSGQRPPSAIGATLSSGDWVGSDDYRGKQLLVVYWSMEDPSYAKWDQALREIRQKNLDRNDFMILSICVDDDFEKWMKFLSAAEPLERNGESIKLWQDKTWWHANAFDHHPSKDLLDANNPTVAHLLSRDGKFEAVRIPLKELSKTVEARLPAKP